MGTWLLLLQKKVKQLSAQLDSTPLLPIDGLAS
jgi:hypothetical protein